MADDVSPPPSASGPGVPEQSRRDDVPGGPEHLAAQLRRMWERLDPVPPGLAARSAFAVEVAGLTADDLDTELELLRLQQGERTGAGARGEGDVRTVTFGGESVTVMLAVTAVAGGHRIDGWVAPGGRRGIEVRTDDGSSRYESDETGRFAVDFVPSGHLQLVLDDDAAGEQARGFVTPALTL